ncbi:LOW QUALITY PROTEIN: helicase c2, partial [Achromobacter xylosoxidans C54]
ARIPVAGTDPLERRGGGRLQLLLRRHRHAVRLDAGPPMEGGGAGGRGPQPGRSRAPHVHRGIEPVGTGGGAAGRAQGAEKAAGRAAALLDGVQQEAGRGLPGLRRGAGRRAGGGAEGGGGHHRLPRRGAAGPGRPGAGLLLRGLAFHAPGRAVRAARVVRRDAGRRRRMGRQDAAVDAVRAQRGARAVPGRAACGGACHGAVFGHPEPTAVLPRHAGPAARGGLDRRGRAVPGRAAGGEGGGQRIHPISRPRAFAGADRGPDRGPVCASARQLPGVPEQLRLPAAGGRADAGTPSASADLAADAGHGRKRPRRLPGAIHRKRAGRGVRGAGRRLLRGRGPAGQAPDRRFHRHPRAAPGECHQREHQARHGAPLRRGAGLRLHLSLSGHAEGGAGGRARDPHRARRGHGAPDRRPLSPRQGAQPAAQLVAGGL